jgi:hypothetical protein
MMKLYDYFEGEINNNLLNKYYVHDKILNYNELIDFLNQNPDKELLRGSELEILEKYRHNKLEEKIKSVNYPVNIFISSYTKPEDNHNIHQSSIFYYDGNTFKKILGKKVKETSGIVIVKNKQIKIEKRKYESLQDLVDNPNVALYIKNNRPELIQIVCYDLNQFDNFINQQESFEIPILFGGSISDEDYHSKYPPSQGGSIVQTAYSRPDVRGRNILYPIFGLLANKNILMADRNMVSKFAHSVWKDFFNGKSPFFKKYYPIDSIRHPITLKNVKDDGRLYTTGSKDENEKLLRLPINYDREKLENMSNLEQNKKLIRTRGNDFINWTYKLKSGKNIIQNVVDILEDRHFKNTKNQKELESQLIALEKSYESKRIF